jgi:superoxide reductase
MNFYLCEICGNVIELLYGEAERIECCSQNMTLLKAKTEDMGFEKHVPYPIVAGNKVKVQIGETLHPSEEKHYIMWIACVNGNEITRVDLKPGEEPSATFEYKKGSTIYAYCNIHGLWKTEII